jgi:hypothetical protein
VALLLACGASDSGTSIDFSFLVDRAIAGNATNFQVAVLKTSKDCSVILPTCLAVNSAIAATDYVQITDPSGKQARAVRFADTLASDSSSQSISVGGISPGTGYIVVVEAIDASNALIGNSCNVVSEIKSGANSLTATIRALSSPPSPACPDANL